MRVGEKLHTLFFSACVRAAKECYLNAKLWHEREVKAGREREGRKAGEGGRSPEEQRQTCHEAGRERGACAVGGGRDRGGGMAETALREVPRTPTRQHGTHGAARRTLGALTAVLNEGVSKAEAQRRFGLGHSALTPGQLEPLIEKSPLFAHLRAEGGDLWSVTVPGKAGQGRVSARQIMARTVESAMEVIAEHGPRHGSLTPEEQRRISFAYRTLQVAQSLGLWRDNQTSAPAELATAHQAEQDRMSAETVLSDHPKEGESLTLGPDAKPVPPSESEG